MTAQASPGHASLDVRLVAGRSAVTSSFATSPLQLLTPRPRGPCVWSYLSSLGGGWVAGDQTRLDLRLDAGARCFLGTQASAKVYRNLHHPAAGHTTHVEVGPDAVLVFAPDPVQAFAGSTYTQRQEFHLDPRAGLVFLDWCTAGRTARQERWAFASYRSRNLVCVADEPVLVDTLHLDAADGPLDARHRLGRFNCLATLAIVGDSLAEFGARLIAEIAGRPIRQREPLLCNASPLRNGAVLRLAGESTEAVGRELHRRLAWFQPLLGDHPWDRKW